MSPIRKRSARFALCALIAVASLVVTSMPAVARADDAVPPAAPVLPVVVTNSGFAIPGPNPRPAGLVTFRVSTPDATGHFLALIRLRPGVTLEQAEAELAGSASTDPAVLLPSLQALYRDVEFAGGAAVFPIAPVDYTALLTAGTYYVVESPPVFVPGRPPFFLQTLEVTDPAQVALPPRVDTAVSVVDLGDKPAFLAPSQFPADATLLVTNLTSQPQELIFARVADGTTDADLQAHFDALLAGQPSPEPLLEGGGGMLAISPGKAAILHIDLPAGRWVLLSFIRNPKTGVQRAYEGLHRVVTLT